MASINGISIKSLKEFKDHDGLPIHQGNVYKGNHKLGFWSQDSWGGPDTFGFDEHELDDAVARYKESDSASDGFREFPTAEMLLEEIVNLAEDEKLFKKALKGGYCSMLLATDGYHVLAIGTDDPRAELPWFKGKCRESFFDDWDGKVTAYNSLEDFEL